MVPETVENDAVGRYRRIAVAVVIVLIASMPLCAASAEEDTPPAGAPAAERLGKSISIRLPITGDGFTRVRQFGRRAVKLAAEKNARLTLIFEFKVTEDREDFGRGSEFGAAYDLADFISGEELGGVRTVAFVPQPIVGHAVLPVLACDEIIMAADASLGKAGADENVITESRQGNYREIAGRRKTIPAEVALWMLDPKQEVWVVETEVSREYVLDENLQKFEDTHTIRLKQKLFDAADPDSSVAADRGVLSGEEARRLNFVGYLADSRQAVARALELPPQAMDEDLSLVRDWKAARVALEGPIDAKMVSVVQDLISDAINLREVNFIILSINSRGGSPTDSIVLSGFLAGLDPSKVRTVAYVAEQARSDTALVALACHQLVMHPEAELGGPGAYRLSEEDISYAMESIRDANGPWKGRSWSLIAAMIDPDLEVYRYTRRAERQEVGYLCDDELAELDKLDDGPEWVKGQERVAQGGQPMKVDGLQAVEYGLANHTVESFAEFKQYYDLPNTEQLEPGWAHHLVKALASPAVTGILLTLAFLAIYAELSAPGVGIGGFVAIVCFLLFFWSHCLEQTAGALEIVLFLGGVACLLLEVFVLPGFGIFGLGGGLLVLVSLILASQTFVLPKNDYQFAQLQSSLMTVAGAGVGVIAIGWLLRKSLPHAPIVNRLFLPPPEGEEAENIERRETLIDLHDFVGRRGTATTQLTPSGKARFGDMLVDVITDGDVIQRGSKVEVVEVHGNRVVVKAAGG